jgi:hypothetical protein
MTATQLRQTGVSFFLGAGASMDMGFPSGAGLKQRLSGDLRQPHESELGRVMLRALPRQREKIRAFGHDLGVSEESSIDGFLDRRREYLDVARPAVGACILEAERNALAKDITRYWLYRFLDRLFEGVKRPRDLDRYYPGGTSFEFLHGLAINTLNYDRLVEWTLKTWIQTRFPKLDLVAGNYHGSLNPDGGIVRHQHGSLGPLFDTPSCRGLPFGAERPADPQQLLELASRLRFWFEIEENTAGAFSITNRIVELRGVHVVTGFGYHKLISGRFGPPVGPDAKLERVIATSSSGCCERANEWLRSVYAGARVNVTHLDHGATCDDAIRVLCGGGDD